MHFTAAFTEIALTLLAAAAIGAAGLWLRQPLIVSFIAVGVLVGPAGVGLVTRHEHVEGAELRDSPGWAGRTLSDLRLPDRFGINVLAVAPEGERFQAPDPRRPFSAEDRLVLAGPRDGIRLARAAR